MTRDKAILFNRKEKATLNIEQTMKQIPQSSRISRSTLTTFAYSEFQQVDGLNVQKNIDLTSYRNIEITHRQGQSNGMIAMHERMGQS